MLTTYENLGKEEFEKKQIIIESYGDFMLLKGNYISILYYSVQYSSNQNINQRKLISINVNSHVYIIDDN